ncbi:unnamed protein product [Penicillium roqueforti FM164]|uniref:Genomic scaffold, ProqFM164S01 n=1 Tax=Penicillium roqueforti (strain FM164) TaxID=1365484 RepID=W6Q2B1_PENRF|nr:unnamed protein product [Penicillium roqueforti FM164]
MIAWEISEQRSERTSSAQNPIHRSTMDIAAAKQHA